MRRRALCRRLILSVALCLLASIPASSLSQMPEQVAYWRQHYEELMPRDDARVARAHHIFERVLQAAWTGHGVRPQLLILKNDPWGFSLPLALPDGWVVLSRSVLDLCYRAPERGEDRLAFVMGHEIAHLLTGHFWHLKFFQTVKAHEAPDLLQLPPAEIRHQELRADRDGLIYAAMADFSTQAIVTEDPKTNFFRDWLALRGVAWDGREVTSKTHPEPIQRAGALRAYLQRVAHDTAAFQAGLWFAYAGDYKRAILAFEHFLSIFPSREVYHNLATSHHQLALQVLQEWKPQQSVLPFQLSLAIDPVTRASRNLLSAQALRSLTEPTSPEVLFQRHMDAAIDTYRRALDHDQSYVFSALNLGSALVVRGLHRNRNSLNADFAEAVTTLLRALEKAPNSPQTPQILNNLGVALYYEEKPDKARAFLHQARALNAGYRAPTFNLSRLAQAQRQGGEPWAFNPVEPATQLASVRSGASPSASPERVMQIGVAALERQIPLDWGQPLKSEIQLGRVAFTVSMYPRAVATLSRDGEILIMMAREGFSGRSRLGIGVGSGAQEVLARYGEPTRRLDAKPGKNWSYDRERIAFQLRDDKVVGWLVY